MFVKRFNVFLAVFLALTFQMPNVIAEDAELTPWAEIALQDLKKINHAITENHPGMVDPENSEFKNWAIEGMLKAKARAASAKDFYDYKRALRFFVNGFHDGHLDIRPNVDSLQQVWPGFLPLAMDGELRIGLSQRSNVPAGAKILSCDGEPAWDLLENNVLPYWWNSEIPHQLNEVAAHLMIVDAGDSAMQFQRCRIENDGKSERVDIAWELISDDVATRLQRNALGWVNPDVGLRKISGFWFISMSTFRIYTEDEVSNFKAFLNDLADHQEQLRNEPMVLDLRGVPGGNSYWGDEVIKKIWGEEWVDYLKAGLESAVDWRVSPDNISRHEDVVQILERDGLAEPAAFYRDLVIAMRTAFEKGEPFVRTGNAAAPAESPSFNPVTSKVYLLTDGVCASACLDFVDMARRLPGVVHVGLPTSADTLYIENTTTDLPSGLTKLSYSLKVYRGRSRGPNEWYEPTVLWPGGEMTDDAIARWLAELE